jgi:hypothetical protein
MCKTSNKLVTFLVLSLAAISCSRTPDSVSKIKFDGGYSVAMDGKISDGVVISRSSAQWQIKSDINDQLYYTMGQLNAWNGVSDLSRTTLSILSTTMLSEGLYEVHYSATLFVSWPRQTAVPAEFDLVMPAQMHKISQFVATSASCREDFSHEAISGNFWYYFRPEAPGCKLRQGGIPGEDKMIVRRFPMTMTISPENTTDKYPEYSKVWEDGKLVVTAMFGKETSGATDSSDAGISAYNDMYRRLRATFGPPTSQSVVVAPNQSPGATHDDIEMEFRTAHGPLKVSIMLLEGLREMTSEQMANYGRRTIDSDLVIYSGHSGLGANIRALGSMGNFQANQYQIFFVNGCDTFGYVGDALGEAHAAVNPGAKKSKYLDIITNSMPSYFHLNARGSITVMSALAGQQLTYRQILQQIDSTQMPVVTGEEDNNWPLPF